MGSSSALNFVKPVLAFRAHKWWSFLCGLRYQIIRKAQLPRGTAHVSMLPLPPPLLYMTAYSATNLQNITPQVLVRKQKNNIFANQ